MSGYFVVDIRHWLDENEGQGVPQLKRKVDFLKELITYETDITHVVASASESKCRR